MTYKADMKREKASIKQILAANIKENRRKMGLTQEKLAEMANMSLHYLAMLESANKFPSGEMLEKLAHVLNIQTYQLFTPTATPEGALLHLEHSIVANIGNVVSETIVNDMQQAMIDMKQVVKEAVKATLKDECKKKK